jgi:DNA helicase-2/ATP-dependent DNA helicase PcrA
MQGIFEFAGATLSWEKVIYPCFPLVDELDVPHRWETRNPGLGDWIAEVREKLIQGEAIDLSAAPVAFRRADTAFDMGPLFDGFGGVEGNLAAIHCSKGVCYRLARAAGGGYQAIEEMAARRLQEFCTAWDACDSRQDRVNVITGLVDDCVNVKALETGAEDNPADLATSVRIRSAVAELYGPAAAEAGVMVLSLIPRRTRYQLYRRELWRDVERAMADVVAGRCASMTEAAERTRQRVSLAGRRLPQRTVSTPLLLKGLEFDHVVVPDATHFTREVHAQAKLFYVAISRATRSLTISARDDRIRFRAPDL